MNSMSNNSGPLNDLARMLKTDPKKAGVLAVLVVVLLVTAGRMLLSGSTRPTPASASAKSTNAGGSKKGGTGSAQSNAALAAHNGAVASALQKWAEAPVPPVSRNLFAVRIDYFPRDGSGTTRSDAADGGFWDRLEKSLAVQADQRNKQENLKANYMAQAAKLRLESTMMGPQPMAMVNGEMVGEGAVVAEFRVLKIEARRIIVEREGIKLEIQMK
jgi:hypothetical protein